MCLNAGGMGRQDAETETLIPTNGGHFVDVIAFHHNAQVCQLPGPDRDTSISDSLTCSQQAAVIATSLTASNDPSRSPQSSEVTQQVWAVMKATQRPVGFDAYNNDVTGDVSKTIDTGQDYHHVPNVLQATAVAFTTEQTPKFNADCALTLTKQSPTGGGQIQSVMQSMQVRRLTPRECERLQGFPDDYTDIKLKGKPTPDGPRYKALGNSMAVPVMAWIGKRIQEVEAINAP
jgi:site-specific DNA-cytosine methylase